MLQNMPLWRLNEKGQLSRCFVAKNFSSAMNFINLTAACAENFGHHPDIHLTTYRNVEVCISFSLNAILGLKLCADCSIHPFNKWNF